MSSPCFFLRFYNDWWLFINDCGRGQAICALALITSTDQSNSIFCCFADSTQTLQLFNVDTSLAQERQMKFEYSSSSSESIKSNFFILKISLKGYTGRNILGINQLMASQWKYFWWWITTDLENMTGSSIYLWETEANGGHIWVNYCGVTEKKMRTLAFYT